MKRILSLVFITTLTGVLCAQPGRGQGQRPGGGQGQGQRPGGGPSRMFPSSLRAGLIETLGRIGTNEAESVLVKTLGVTGSGVEVSLIDRMLTNIKEGAQHEYVNEVLAAARDLILNPSDTPDDATDADQRAARDSTRNLWSILRRYKDTTFTEKAGEILISEEGSLNGEALRYLREVLEKDAVPILVDAYQNSDADDRAKGELWGVINDHIDDHAAAGEILVERFKEALVKMEEEETARAQREADRAAGGGEGGDRGRGRGGFGGFGGRGGGGNSRGTAVRELQRLGEGRDLDADAINNRRSILASVKAATSDPDFQTMIGSVETRLDELADPTAETSSRFRVSDPKEAARREEQRQRLEQFRNRGREGGQTPPDNQ